MSRDLPDGMVRVWLELEANRQTSLERILIRIGERAESRFQEIRIRGARAAVDCSPN